MLCNITRVVTGSIGYSNKMALYSSCQSAFLCFSSLMKQEARSTRMVIGRSVAWAWLLLHYKFEGLGSGCQM